MLAARIENEIPPSHSLMETGLLENSYDIATPIVVIDMSLTYCGFHDTKICLVQGHA